MSTNFMFDFLPSFYKDFMVDKNGVSVLTPLFDQYTNCMGDALYQAQQLSLVPYLEKCPIVFEEYFKIIDVRQSNRIPNTNRYIIENDIVGIYDLYYDGALTQLFNYNVINYILGHDESTNIRYIEFDAELDPRITTLFVDKVYKDKFVLRDVFGKLLNYEKTFTFVEYWDNAFTDQYNLYKKELLGILYTSMHGQTFESIKKGLSIFIGLSFSPFDGIVKHIGNANEVTIEDFTTGKEQIVICAGNLKDTIQVGTILNKYDIIDEDQFYIYDIFSNPIRFSQLLVSDYSTRLIDLLFIDTDNKEQYAHLTFDSLVVYDGTNIFWDMGNHTGVSNSLPVGINDINAPTNTLLSNLTTFNDSRFESLPIYEMFRNLFIIEYTGNSEGGNYEHVDKTNYFLNRFKPIYTKYLVYENSTFNVPLTAPYIIQQPQDYPQTELISECIYNVIAGGSQTLDYQWQRMEVSLYGNGGVWNNVGTNNSTVTIPTEAYDQYVRVIISNQQGSVTSDMVLCLIGTGGV